MKKPKFIEEKFLVSMKMWIWSLTKQFHSYWNCIWKDVYGMLNIIPVVQVNNKIVPFEPFLVTNLLFSYSTFF